MAEPPQRRLQSLLQAAVQTVHWTYSLFWQFCPQEGMIAWRDGYYNGAIKTRKTVQATEESAEEGTLQRSQQLRELYDTLAGGETSHQERRPSAALSPEDLTESEWFYLMCVSFSFPPGIGLPGKAYVERQHIWLTGANKADNKLFSRAILAESAKIQTVVCIPVLDGVVELGTTEMVQEDIGLIQHVKSLFTGFDQNPNPSRPALSGHSTSNPTSSNFYSPALFPPFELPQVAEKEEEQEEEVEDVAEEEDDEIGFDSGRMETLIRSDQNPVEAMQFNISDKDIRAGSPDDSSYNLHSNFQRGNLLDHHGHGGAAVMLMWPCKDLIVDGTGLQPPHSEVIAEEDTHYSQTVSTILENQSNRWSKLSSSAASAFSKWLPSPTSSSSAHHHNLLLDGASQWVLKYILFTLPLLHTKPRASAAATPADELSGNHVLAERRRREKLNERFVILRSMVPFITKMDKASILADTIEYLKQLKKRIQDLESRVRQLEAEKGGGREKRKMRAAPPQEEVEVEVSIIECDALVEISCLQKEGLVLEVMHVLGGLGLQVTTVQSSINNNNGIFNAELRAKVSSIFKVIKGRKPSIMEVKRTIKQIIKER